MCRGRRGLPSTRPNNLSNDHPQGNIEKTVDYFKQFDINALGIASFGPIEIRKIHQNQDILRLHQRWDGEMLMC